MPTDNASERSSSASKPACRCQLRPQVHIRRQRLQTLGAAEECADREGGCRQRNADGGTVRRCAWIPTTEAGSAALYSWRVELCFVHVCARSAETKWRPIRTRQHTVPVSWYVSAFISLATFPTVGPGTPHFPRVHLLSYLFPFYFSLSLIGFTYFLLLSIPSLSTFVVFGLCYLYSLVMMDSGVLFYLV